MSELEKKVTQPAESVNSAAEKKAKSDKKKDTKKSGKVRRWLKDLKGELKKVTWPSAKDTAKNVLVVIACVLFVGICIWVFDYVIHAVVEALLNLFN